MLQTKTISCDFCVVGGGISGMAAAISAAREGLKVVLMHERSVLGGNASSEIRMWISNAKGENNRETGIVEEIALENMYRNPSKSYAIWDTVLYDFIKREENITLLLNCPCMDAEIEEGSFKDGRDRKIKSVTGYQMTTQQKITVYADYYCDSSGDSILAPLTGAEFRLGREAKSEFNEDTDTLVADKTTMGMSCLIFGRETTQEVPYIPPQWAAKLTPEHFQDYEPNLNSEYENFWYLELGGNRNTIDDTEQLRDELVALAAGTWDYIKNKSNRDTKNWDLDFLGFIPGKRESRRLCGEYTMTSNDIFGKVSFPDEIAFGGWPVDDHYPGGFYHHATNNRFYDTPAPYSIPYRVLYSKNVENLYFAGRNISVTHMAMSSMRIMATCSLLGEAVGKGVSLAVKHNSTPNDVYKHYIEELQTLLLNEDCFLPSKKRVISDTCLKATLSGGCDILRNGEDRPHSIYGTTEETAYCAVALKKEVSYSFPASTVHSCHIVFNSDLSRNTLPGGHCEKNLPTRANRPLNAPHTHLPKTLCRDFKVYGELNGRREELLSVTDNRKRAYHLPIEKTYDKLILVPETTWGEGSSVDVISFDFC